MKKCIFSMVIDDAKKFGYNSNKYLEIYTNDGWILVPVIEIEAENTTELKAALDKIVNKLLTKAEAITDKQIIKNSRNDDE